MAFYTLCKPGSIRDKHPYCTRFYPCNSTTLLMLLHKGYQSAVQPRSQRYGCLCLLNELGTNMTTLQDTNQRPDALHRIVGHLKLFLIIEWLNIIFGC